MPWESPRVGGIVVRFVVSSGTPGPVRDLQSGGAIGLSIVTAIALARAGADVVVADIDSERVEDTISQIRAAGRQGRFIHTDVSSRESVEALVEEAIRWQGRCDLFMSNVAISGRGAPHGFSVEDWRAVLEVNLYGAIWGTRAVLPHMLQRDYGHLVFVSSVWGLRGSADMAPYSVSKFGVVGLAESVAMYLKGTRVGVSLVVPAYVVGGRMWQTLRIAGADRVSSKEVLRLRLENRTPDESPSPESMAATIVDGIQSGRFYIFQAGDGEHEDWARNEMRAKWNDPDAYVLGGG